MPVRKKAEWQNENVVTIIRNGCKDWNMSVRHTLTHIHTHSSYGSKWDQRFFRHSSCGLDHTALVSLSWFLATKKNVHTFSIFAHLDCFSLWTLYFFIPITVSVFVCLFVYFFSFSLSVCVRHCDLLMLTAIKPIHNLHTGHLSWICAVEKKNETHTHTLSFSCAQATQAK